MGYLEKFVPLYGLLTAVALIFGTFEHFSKGLPFDIAWFANLLGFAVGFPVLLLIAVLVFTIGLKGEAEILKTKE